MVATPKAKNSSRSSALAAWRLTTQTHRIRIAASAIKLIRFDFVFSIFMFLLILSGLKLSLRARRRRRVVRRRLSPHDEASPIQLSEELQVDAGHHLESYV